ncbi:putative metal-sulfur cluster biosynthetic enzyme [Terriglobus roseus DSM 18391]|uniref:Putative metal-sulfur cluster biosynthetic enzyme n=1 Tax=Terriglobus roseus (strain DSM 18391 / NRRL B-41598 / KBS 63) TaxID=926566 RepID=U3GJM2_TERRK|nr:metal-sulfur cluster assembly factor [Terriglobus roseus]AFL89753.1 putative metal-sulfur cluster biosynthetic enzyme [Terriglobus roseus DSM 18391]
MNPAPTQTDIREALRVCFDPELSVNIVDLGLVYDIQVQQDTNWPGFEPRYVIHITMTMRAPSDEREAMLIGQVKNRLAGIPEVSRSEVKLVWEPAWTADRMTPAARQQLGLDRAPKQGLITIKL